MEFLTNLSLNLNISEKDLQEVIQLLNLAHEKEGEEVLVEEETASKLRELATYAKAQSMSILDLAYELHRQKHDSHQDQQSRSFSVKEYLKTRFGVDENTPVQPGSILETFVNDASVHGTSLAQERYENILTVSDLALQSLMLTGKVENLEGVDQKNDSYGIRQASNQSLTQTFASLVNWTDKPHPALQASKETQRLLEG